MIRTDGKYFTTAIKSLLLSKAEAADATKNARNIFEKIIAAYDTHIAVGRIGEGPQRVPSGFSPAAQANDLTGLVYGRIQSGKTRAMIASTALAFDNGFRIVVVLTSNINDLVNQTHFDFASGLPNVMVFTKDDELASEVKNVKLDLDAADGRMLIVCSKGAGSLSNVISFLKKVEAKNYPAIIFDDEGDQASLDTNTRKRSVSNIAVAPSPINRLIQQELRRSMPCHIYVSVTGTPQAVLLQTSGSSNRPSFIESLPPGRSYVGGDHFFGDEEPEKNAKRLIRIVDQHEKNRLLGTHGPIPDGLRHAILFFLLSSAAAIRNNGLPTHGKGFSFLCHPSLKNDEQVKAARRIGNFLDTIKATLLNAPGKDPEVIAELSEEYNNLKETLGAVTPSLDDLSSDIVGNLRTRKILIINARAKRQGIAYGSGLNFLIGGNTLGRGIAIRDLLVTYYLRDSRITRIDTMHQHARMFGYRHKTLPYTRLFIPRRLYYRFRDIHHSDKDLREFIDLYKDSPQTFPIEFAFDLRPTRSGVLDVNSTDTLQPRKQIYPNYVVIPQKTSSYSRIEALLNGHFGTSRLSDASGASGVEISADDAVALVKLIKTKSDNTWRDRTIAAVLKKVAAKFGNKVILKFRTATRSVKEEGFMSTGTLSGTEYANATAAPKPTLWIMRVDTTADSFCGAGRRFMYPTFVIPSSLPKLLMFTQS